MPLWLIAIIIIFSAVGFIIFIIGSICYLASFLEKFKK